MKDDSRKILAKLTFNQAQSILKDVDLIILARDAVAEDPDFKQELWRLVEKSKDDSQAVIGAANAITVLVAAGESCSGRDLRGIKINGANVSGGFFDKTDLRGADLSGVTMIGVWLRDADLSDSRMSDIKLGDKIASDVELRFLQGHDDTKDTKKGVTCCDLSQDGRFLLSGSDDCSVRRWDMETGKQLAPPFKGYQHPIGVCCFSSDGKLLAFGGHGKTVRLMDVGTKGRDFRMEHKRGPITSCSFSRDGHLLASGGSDKTVRLWSTANHKELHTFKGHGGPVRSCSFSSNAEFLVSGSADKTLRLWSVTEERQLYKFTGHGGAVNSCSFSPNDDELLLSGSDDYTVRLWSKGRESCPSFTGHNGSVNSCCFSSDGHFIASGSSDNTVRLWDVMTHRCLLVLDVFHREVKSVCWKNNRLVVCSDDNIYYFDVLPESDQRIIARLQRIITSKQMPLCADGMQLERVIGLSESNRLLLVQRGAKQSATASASASSSAISQPLPSPAPGNPVSSLPPVNESVANVVLPKQPIPPDPSTLEHKAVSTKFERPVRRVSVKSHKPSLEMGKNDLAKMKRPVLSLSSNPTEQPIYEKPPLEKKRKFGQFSPSPTMAVKEEGTSSSVVPSTPSPSSYEKPPPEKKRKFDQSPPSSARAVKEQGTSSSEVPSVPSPSSREKPPLEKKRKFDQSSPSSTRVAKEQGTSSSVITPIPKVFPKQFVSGQNASPKVVTNIDIIGVQFKQPASPNPSRSKPPTPPKAAVVVSEPPVLNPSTLSKAKQSVSSPSSSLERPLPVSPQEVKLKDFTEGLPSKTFPEGFDYSSIGFFATKREKLGECTPKEEGHRKKTDKKQLALPPKSKMVEHTQYSQEALCRIGRWGEDLVYKILEEHYVKQYPGYKFIPTEDGFVLMQDDSNFIELIWHNKEGESFKSKDFTVIKKIGDARAEKQCIEVKTTTGIEQHSAILSKKEFLKIFKYRENAQHHPELHNTYSIFRVFGAGKQDKVRVEKIEDPLQKILDGEIEVNSLDIKI